jgi:hypothetical protein
MVTFWIFEGLLYRNWIIQILYSEEGYLKRYSHGNKIIYAGAQGNFSRSYE